jgi:DNA-binding SARP family transcriptional activator
VDQPALPSRGGLRLNLLGGFSCTSDGRVVAGIAYDKMRALLAYLAVEPARDHRRDVLAELLWSGSDPQTARGNLRRTLSDLRRVLEPPDSPVLFAATKSTIRFLPNAVVDVVHFADAAPVQDVDARADDAHGKLALYAGEFMAGFHLPGCPLFEEWLLSWREALHRRALALLEQVGSLHEGRGEPARALPSALRWAELDPWNEAAHRRLMRLYAACGQRAAALRQFDLCRDLLYEEFGVPPEPETAQLAERLQEGAADAPPTTAGAPALAHRPAPGERRQATVLFCDLMLPGTDDLDDAIERLRAPRARCIECIEGFSGFVVPMHGGGLLAYFGYPRSHEDSAVRAVRAALALLREAVDDVRIRVGVHTGLILTGEDIALPDSVGKTSGVAIQLRRCIDDGQVVVSEDTQRLAAGYFRFSSLGLHVLPDAARPMKVFSVDSDSGARNRLEAATRLFPLVGRVAELAQLAAAWDAARHGAAQAVLVRGDAAIGKSRLVHAFKQQLAGERHTVRELRCFPEYEGSPFHPLLALLEGDLGFLPGESPISKAAKLAAHLASVHPSCDARMLPMLLSLCSLPTVAASAPLPAPQEQKRLIHQFLREMLIPPARPWPLLLVVEDLHWADPSTLELLRTLPECDPQAGALLAVFTARPGIEPPGAASVLSLEPLPPRHIEALIRAVGGSLATAWVQRIVERADGVPLFAEELARNAALDDRAHIPATLRDMLAARMDALGEAKPLIQLAATIGREFSRDLLRQAAGSEPTAFGQTMHGLIQTGLILPGLNDATCQFKHALIQEAAYESQSRSDRRRAHRQIATALQGESADRETALPELVARHLGAAGDVRQSVGFWIRAAHHATATSSHQEAIAHFEQGLDALRSLPLGAERDRDELSILLSLCPALHTRHGYGSPEATRATARIDVLREQGLDVPDMFLVEWAGLRNTMARIGPGRVPEGAARLLALARDDRVKQQAAHYAAAVGCFWLGAFERSGGHAETAMASYRPDDHQPMLDLFDEDLSVSFAGHRAWALCFMGCVDQAITLSVGMIRQARAMRHPKTLAMALLFATMLHRWLNQHPQVLVLAAETIPLTREHGMVHWTATAELLHGKAQVMHEGRRDLSELKLLAAQMAAAAPSYATVRLVDMAELHLFLQLPDEALGLLAQSEAAESGTGTLQFAAERHRIEGECLLARPEPDTEPAEACFQRALAISRRQGARLLELRSAVSLARLWQRGGQHARARRLLQAVYAGFTEGWEAPDLVAAAVLLQSLDRPMER